LVGDINQLGGVCDDCPIDDLDEEVVEIIVPGQHDEELMGG